MTPNQIDSYLRSKKSPLAGYGKSFVSAGRRYGVSPALLVAIAGAESSFGKVNSGSNNAWGWGPGIDFGSWDAGINAVAKGLKSGYLDQGKRSIAAIGAKYAPGNAANDPTGLNSHWTKNVTQFYKELGAGGALTPASPSEPQIDPNTGSAPAVPDLSSAALTSLGRTSARRSSPTENLSDLVAAVSAGSVGGGRPVSTGASPSPTTPAGTPSIPIRVDGKVTPRVKQAIGLVREAMGSPYVWGGESYGEGGFDCSGLLYYAWGKVGVKIPRVSEDQWRAGTPVRLNQLKPGDAVFFRQTGRGPGHVAMYIGGGRIIEARKRGTNVMVSKLAGRNPIGARRFA